MVLLVFLVALQVLSPLVGHASGGCNALFLANSQPLVSWEQVYRSREFEVSILDRLSSRFYDARAERKSVGRRDFLVSTGQVGFRSAEIEGGRIVLRESREPIRVGDWIGYSGRKEAFRVFAIWLVPRPSGDFYFRFEVDRELYRRSAPSGSAAEKDFHREMFVIPKERARVSSDHFQIRVGDQVGLRDLERYRREVEGPVIPIVTGLDVENGTAEIALYSLLSFRIQRVSVTVAEIESVVKPFEAGPRLALTGDLAVIAGQ